MTVTITADDLAARRTTPVLLDVRWKLGDDQGYQHYLDGHIPGAVYVDLTTELAGPVGTGTGRHPLPDPDALQESMRRWGIDADSSVVVYDDNGGMSAARAWWLLRWAGLSDVVLLDGGLTAWTESGRSSAVGEGDVPRSGSVTVQPDSVPRADIDTVATTTDVLLDARAAERYRGDAEPVDPRAGHIPGALSAPTADNVDDRGRFRSPDELRRRFDAVGVDGSLPVTVYCGSGVTAAHEVAALAIAGIDARLYPGSWSQWSADADRPVATGDAPG
ncbi:sulfurtransferase [Williamsia sterculiae]|uniref:Thiosulfate/3-mercaptopyruvate sulfurtransferase n=1 Tax=Williamsia sterculiae TaxID=1344003 RepID=A0A1N7CLG6_9NOCA|nr:sulfurtransferase [Williamsia sterculiae]SIR64254.1 thiosulfate/3-mercaptopyruvate sulfurtransferase [Williamsia sterculiae]